MVPRAADRGGELDRDLDRAGGETAVAGGHIFKRHHHQRGVCRAEPDAQQGEGDEDQGEVGSGLADL
jgi:hypothetical protein